MGGKKIEKELKPATSGNHVHSWAIFTHAPKKLNTQYKKPWGRVGGLNPHKTGAEPAPLDPKAFAMLTILDHFCPAQILHDVIRVLR